LKISKTIHFVDTVILALFALHRIAAFYFCYFTGSQSKITQREIIIVNELVIITR